MVLRESNIYALNAFGLFTGGLTKSILHPGLSHAGVATCKGVQVTACTTPGWLVNKTAVSLLPPAQNSRAPVSASPEVNLSELTSPPLPLWN